MNPLAMDRRNLTPDQLALVMGRHYNRTKKDPVERMLGNDFAKRGAQNERQESDATDVKLSKQYGTSPATVRRNAQFAAAVDTLRAVDPDIEAKGRSGNTLLKTRIVFPASFAWSAPRIVSATHEASPRGPLSSVLSVRE